MEREEELCGSIREQGDRIGVDREKGRKERERAGRSEGEGGVR